MDGFSYFLKSISGLASPEVITTIVCFMIIKYNDLRHLEKWVKEFKDNTKEQFEKITSSQDAQGVKINRMDKSVAVLKQRTDTLEKSVKNNRRK